MLLSCEVFCSSSPFLVSLMLPAVLVRLVLLLLLLLLISLRFLAFLITLMFSHVNPLVPSVLSCSTWTITYIYIL